MPIDVCDKNGNHIGVVHKRFMDKWNICMVALTDVRARELKVDIEKIKELVAAEFGCKKMFGKVKEDELREKMYELLKSENRNIISYEELMITVFLNHFSEKKIENFIDEKALENKIRGYILYDLNKLELKQNSIAVNQDLGYINEQLELDWDKTAIYAKIIDYPILETSSYYIKLNEAYEYTTKIKILSGNYEEEMKLSTILDCKKDMGISLVASKKKIDRVFCDGRIYML